MREVRSGAKKKAVIRAKAQEGIGRAIFCTVKGKEVVILHEFIKKTQKTPKKGTRHSKTTSKRGKAMKKLTHDLVKKRLLSDSAVREEYDRLMQNYDIISTLIKARKRAHKTQEQVAELMKTTASVICRIEAGGGKNHHSPPLMTLSK